MNLFMNNNGVLETIDHHDFSLEKEIQKIVENNVEALFELKLVSSEFAVGDFRIDSLCFDEENNSFVIIEYKRGASYSVIDQGYSYLSVMLNNKSDFILEYNENHDRKLRREEVNWPSSRVIFIAPGFNAYQKNSVNFRDVPFELWEIKRYVGGIIVFDKYHSNSKASIASIGAPNSDDLNRSEMRSLVSRVSAEVVVFNEDDHVSKLSSHLVPVWLALREKLEQFPDVTFYANQTYIACRKDNTVVCYIRPLRDLINITILRGNLSPGGDKSRGYFDIDDPKKFSFEKAKTLKDGGSTQYYIIKLDSIKDVEYSIFLLKQKYDSL